LGPRKRPFSFSIYYYNRFVRCPAPKLEDELIVVRRWQEKDIADSIVACADLEVIRWIPRIPTPYGEQDAREFLDHADRGWEEGTSCSFAITERASGRTVGSIGVALNEAIGEIGYFVFAGYRRRGIGERALRLVSQWALEELELGRLQLTAMVDNVASARLAEKVGFRREGVLRAWMDNRGERADVIMHSLLPGEIDRLSGD
jgi:RimJ/RimL family protein N-acetyltransferase